MTTPEKNEIDWYETISSSIYVFVIGAFMVWATVSMGWWALVWPIGFAISQFINRIESYRLGHLRRGKRL
jgi:hypothetical protein